MLKGDFITDKLEGTPFKSTPQLYNQRATVQYRESTKIWTMQHNRSPSQWGARNFGMHKQKQRQQMGVGRHFITICCIGYIWFTWQSFGSGGSARAVSVRRHQESAELCLSVCPHRLGAFLINVLQSYLLHTSVKSKLQAQHDEV